jgi:hypothetical protein
MNAFKLIYQNNWNFFYYPDDGSEPIVFESFMLKILGERFVENNRNKGKIIYQNKKELYPHYYLSQYILKKKKLK